MWYYGNMYWHVCFYLGRPIYSKICGIMCLYKSVVSLLSGEEFLKISYLDIVRELFFASISAYFRCSDSKTGRANKVDYGKDSLWYSKIRFRFWKLIIFACRLIENWAERTDSLQVPFDSWNITNRCKLYRMRISEKHIFWAHKPSICPLCLNCGRDQTAHISIRYGSAEKIFLTKIIDNFSKKII